MVTNFINNNVRLQQGTKTMYNKKTRFARIVKKNDGVNLSYKVQLYHRLTARFSRRSLRYKDYSDKPGLQGS